MKKPILSATLRGLSTWRSLVTSSLFVTLLLGATALTGRAADAWAIVSDPKDMADTSGDIRSLAARVKGENLYLTMTVEGVAAPSTAQTPEGMVNRYYYHWLLDTDNNPATGRSNAEYEGTPTGVVKPVGTERVVMIGWRDGKPEGVNVYDPLNEDVLLKTNFMFQASGNTLAAVIPLADLGLSSGQTIAVSAFQEGASDGWAVDWMESQELTLTGPTVAEARVADVKDMADTSGDIRAISAHVEGESLLLSMTVEGVAAPSVEQTPEGMVNRYYYHWLLDTDNNPATGRSNAEYEGTPTGVVKPVGTERVVMIGWRDGKPEGVDVYDPLNEDVLLMTNFTFQASGNTLAAVIPLADLGLSVGQTIAVSAFQEGASDGWAVDWMESQELTLDPLTSGRMKIDGLFQDWTDAAAAGVVTAVDDPLDMADSSGDIRQIQATVEGGYLYLRTKVEGIALPSVEQTPEGMVNRYYYHWLLDTDNNPATGRSNAEYEGTPTGVTKPVGTERVIMIGWRDGSADGIEVYDPLNEDVILLSDFEYSPGGDSVEARIRLAQLNLLAGQTIAISAFQEGASDGWAVDWMESSVMTLTEGGAAGMTLNNVFSGDAYGYEIQVEDAGVLQVDTATVVVRVDGETVQPTVSKTGGVTTITGAYAALLPANTVHKVSLSLRAGDQPQAKDFVYTVEPYTVLPVATSLKQVNPANAGFVVRATQISTFQSGVTSVHSNRADLAELQFAGQLTNEAGGFYYNEADLDWSHWVVTPEVVTGTVNWFELAPDLQASLNFTNDVPFPGIPVTGAPFEGVVMELLTYVNLNAGYHKLGLYTEGGHKISAGLAKTDPVLSLFDNSGEVPLVPTYFARNQFFSVVATESGYYPLRVLWFQSKRDQEPALMLELFSVKDRALHLMNDTTDAKSVRAYRAGPLVGSGAVTTPVGIRIQGGNLVIQFTGMLQAAETITGPWRDYADSSQSPLALPNGGTTTFFRSRSY